MYNTDMFISKCSCTPDAAPHAATRRVQYTLTRLHDTTGCPTGLTTGCIV